MSSKFTEALVLIKEGNGEVARDTVRDADMTLKMVYKT